MFALLSFLLVVAVAPRNGYANISNLGSPIRNPDRSEAYYECPWVGFNMRYLATNVGRGYTFLAWDGRGALNQVPVTLYYETKCPYSTGFIMNKLVPTYNDKRYDFAGLLANLILVPYGHVKEIDAAQYQYSCQHGTPECEGNKLHGCAVRYIKDNSILLNYIGCLANASETSTYYPVNECKDIVPNDLIRQISKCYNTHEGWDIFNQSGSATNTLFGGSKFYVPYLSFNNVRNDVLSETSKKNFRKALCVANGVRNEACSDYYS